MSVFNSVHIYALSMLWNMPSAHILSVNPEKICKGGRGQIKLLYVCKQTCSEIRLEHRRVFTYMRRVIPSVCVYWSGHMQDIWTLCVNNINVQLHADSMYEKLLDGVCVCACNLWFSVCFGPFLGIKVLNHERQWITGRLHGHQCCQIWYGSRRHGLVSKTAKL